MKSEWKKLKIGDVCTIKHGYAFKGVHFCDEKTEHIVTTPGNFAISGGFKLDKPKYYRGPIPQDYILSPGDIIVTMTDLSKDGDTLGYAAIVPESDNAIFLHNQRIGLIENISDSIDKGFLYWLMRTYHYQKYIVNHASGSTVKHTSPSSIASYSFQAPPLPIQRKIASILSALDDKIETNNAICRNLDELLLAVYRNVKYVNECVVKELHDLAEFSKNKKQISELNCQSYFSTENMLPGKAGAVAAESLPTMPKATACNPGDILVSNIRPYFKKIVYCSTNCGCSSDVLCLHPKEDIYSTWLFCSLYEDDFFDYVAAGSKGTKMPRGDKAHIMRYGIDVPPRKKLEEFKSMGNLVLTQINNLRSENKHLSQLRDSILPKLMNGELDVDKIEL